MTADPYQALVGALRDIVAAAVADGVARALASSNTSADDAVMVDVPETARRTGLGVTSVKKLIAAGDLASIVVGRRRLVRVADIDAFAAGRT